jgi:tRNA(adenine34) deaminase
MTATGNDIAFMRLALEEAEAARREGEVPAGALVVCEGQVLGCGHNRSIAGHDPTGHAEIVALREAAARLRNHRLPPACTLYATIEPCAMCAGAIVQARVARVVYGCEDPKAGALRSLYRIADDPRLNHRAEIIGGVLAEECAEQVRSFFQQKR